MPAATRFSDSFLDALGEWQLGWREDPSRQQPVREALLREATEIGPDFKIAPPVIFRKRHLYKRDMLPLLLQGAIDDGACSWTAERAFADRFKDEWRDGAITGAIIRHEPRAQDIVLNIPLLWEDLEFISRLDEYEAAGGAHATTIRHYRGPNDQFEIIAKSPLIITDVIRFSGKVEALEALIEQAGLFDEDDIERAFKVLGAVGIYEGSQMKLDDDNSQRVVEKVLERISDRFASQR